MLILSLGVLCSVMFMLASAIHADQYGCLYCLFAFAPCSPCLNHRIALGTAAAAAVHSSTCIRLRAQLGPTCGMVMLAHIASSRLKYAIGAADSADVVHFCKTTSPFSTRFILNVVNATCYLVPARYLGAILY